MTGLLIVVGLVVGLMIVRSLISAVTDKGIDLAGRAIGGMVKAGAPQGVVALTMPSDEVRNGLVTAGTMDPHSSCLMTPTGVAVELTARPTGGSAGFKCRWDASAIEIEATRVMADVVRAVRTVDPSAQVVL